MHPAYIRVIKVNESRKGVSRKSGNPYEIQEAECLILDDKGDIEHVGVFMVPRDMMGKLQPGDYAATYSLGVDMERRITARITQLQPVQIVAGKGAVPMSVKAAA